MFRKLTSKLGFFSLMIIVLITSACSSNTKVDDTKPVKIVIHHFYSGLEVNIVKEALAPYQEAHKNVDIEFKSLIGSSNDFISSIKKKINSQDQTDIIWLPSSVNIADLVDSKLISSIEDYIGTINVANYYPTLIDKTTYKDELYGLPFYYNTYLILYNKNLFEQYNVPLPNKDWSYDEFAEAAKSLTRPAEGVVGVQNGESLYFAVGSAFGGTAFSEDGRQLDVAKGQFVEGLNYLTNLFKENRVDGRKSSELSNGRSIVPNYESGNTGMIVTGTLQVKALAEKVPNSQITPFPKGPFKQQGIGILDSLVISSKSTNKEAAFDVIKYLSNDEECALRLVNSGFGLPLITTDKVSEEWSNSYSDPSWMETLSYIVTETNNDNLGFSKNVPGYSAILGQLIVTLTDPSIGMYSGSYDMTKFEPYVLQLNQNWHVLQSSNSNE